MQAVNVGRLKNVTTRKHAHVAQPKNKSRLVSSVFQSVTTNSGLGRMQLGLMDPLVTRATKSTDQEQ